MLGFTIGILAEVGSLAASFFGSNLFHGGHPNNIVNVLLPGIGIAEYLSDNVPPGVFGFILVISLFQFPVYGGLGGYDYARKTLSRITIVIIMLHLCGSTIAFYGLALDKQWRNNIEKYGACIRANSVAENLTNNSVRIVNLVKWIDQSGKELERLKTEKDNGAVFIPDPEPSLIKNLENQRNELEQQWQFYKNAGGPAESPEEVSVIPGPCGETPIKPTLF